MLRIMIKGYGLGLRLKDCVGAEQPNLPRNSGRIYFFFSVNSLTVNVFVVAESKFNGFPFILIEVFPITA